MGWQHTSYAIPLLVAAAVSAALALHAWRRRDTPGARAVASLMSAVFVWGLGYAFELGAAGLQTKIFWAKVEYLGIVAVPVAWLAFALRYTGRERRLTRRNLALLAIIPTVILLLVVTNEAHGLVWSRTALDPSGTFLLVDYGAVFWVHWAYSYLLLLAGTYLLISTLVRSPRLYRKQGGALLVAVAAPWIGNGMYILNLNPFPNLDLTPFAFVISGVALSWGLFRFRLLDIVPVARDSVVEGMDDGVIAVDVRGRVVDLNPAAQRILDSPASEAVGSILARIAPDLGALLEGYGAIEEVRKEVERGEGRVRRTYDLALSTLRDHGGRRTGRLLVLRDVTERKRAEEELQEAEAKYRTLVEQIPAVTYIQEIAETRSSRTTPTLYASPQIEAQSGYPPQAFVEDPELWLKLLHPEDRERVLAEDERTDETGEPFRMEYRMIAKDGRVVWVRDEAVPVRDEEGQPRFWQGVQLDITELKQVAKDLRETKEAADAANQAKSEFLSRMSHELRTPLNAILGFAQLLEMEDLGSEERESVGQILKAGRHLLELINEVLDIARIEAGRLALSMEPVLVRDVIQETVELVRPLAAKRGIRLDGDLVGTHERHVMADRQRLRQVLLNLLSNAVKYNREGGAVTLSCERTSGSRLRIRVSDTGPGLTPEQMERLFSPFERLEAEGTETEGTGIGLALTKGLVELMEGEIGVESDVGMGSTFWVELTRTEGQLERLEQTEGEEAQPPTEAPVRARRVLYIEDNPSNLKLVQRILNQRWPEVELISAMEGQLGLDLAGEHRLDLILLDLHLPGMPGDEVLWWLRKDDKTREIPVVILSADATPGRIQRLLEAGARAYLTKPINVKEFLRTVNEVLREGEG